MPNFPPIQPLASPSGAWNALPQALQSGIEGYKEGRTLQQALMMKMQQMQLQRSEVDKNNLQSDAIRGKVAGVADPTNPGFDLTGNPMNATPPPSPAPAGPAGKGPFIVPNSNPGVKPLLDAQGKPVDTSGMSPADINKLKISLATGAQSGQFGQRRADTMAGAMSGRQAASSAVNDLSPSTRLSLKSAHNVAPLMDALIDVHDAYQKSNGGQDSTITNTVLQKLNQNPTISGLMQSGGIDTSSLAALHESLVRNIAQEDPRVINASTGEVNQQMAQEIANGKLPRIQDKDFDYFGKLANYKHSSVDAAYNGAVDEASRGGMNPNGTFLNQGFSNTVNNLKKERANVVGPLDKKLQGRLSGIPGVDPNAGTPGLQPDEILKLKSVQPIDPRYPQVQALLKSKGIQ